MGFLRGLAVAAAFSLLIALGSGCAIPILGARPDGGGASRRVEPRAHLTDAESRARAQAERSEQACFSALQKADVAFERVATRDAQGVRMPLRLRGPIGGVSIVSREHKPVYAILDCRLALSLLSWAKILRAAGVTEIEHYSMYRPGARVGGSGHVSGHARGLAIDAARFHLDDGSVVNVEEDWEQRRHSPPCPRPNDDAWPSRLLHRVVCDAVRRDLFQVVITPNHDRAHDNHVHLERKPEVSWTYVR